MVSARKHSREAKNGEISTSEGKSNSEKSCPSESAGLRRSSRETVVKKGSGLSPTSKRKSDRTEHHSPVKPPEEASARKSSADPSPLRRSDRGKTSSSSGIPSSSKKHKIVPNPLLEENRKDQKEKTVMQLNLETKKVEAKPFKVRKKKGRKTMHCKAYYALYGAPMGKSPAGLNKKPEGVDKLLDEDNIAHRSESDCDDQTSTAVASVHKNAGETSKENVAIETDSGKEATSTTRMPDTMVENDDVELERHTICNDAAPENGSPRSLKPPTGQSTCFKCNLGGELLSCEGRRCKKSYHLSCLDPPLDEVPLGVWHCLDCVKKKLESGVHSVSDGVELIWDAKEVNVLDVGGMRKDKEFLVKYKGLAHIHNRWIPESKLQFEAPSLVAKFSRKHQASSWKHDWTIPHRLLQKRMLMSPEQYDLYRTERAEKKIDSKYEWLVKWKGLDYEHATWELDNAVLFKSPDGLRLIEDYENRHKRMTGASSSKVDKVSDGDHDFIDKLHEFWRKDQNTAAVIDDQSNERFVKVISLVQSFQSNNSRPFLIITTSTTLNLWELEFFQGAPNLYALVYRGNKDLRKIVRKLEFYSEGDSIMFQVLVTTLDIVLEDLEILRKIKWETIIIDEPQRTKVSSHCAEVKLLEANRRLLILSCQLKENVAEYHSLLCLLESLKDSPNRNSVSVGDNIVSLTDKLSKYIAYRCKPDSSKFREYWVPIEMANLQVEQYCATFISNAAILCGTHKSNCVAGLRDVIISSRKCCDHPYIVDENTPGHLSGKGLPASENLNFGINESGKFQFLDVMLSEFKKQGLRAVILFQELGKDAVGNFLEDFMRQRFGPDSFERIVAGIQANKRNVALNKFNEKSTQFVFLMETRACLPSIKLLSVNAVIIFGSDWNPMNDMRVLQRVTLDSSSEQIPVFRLFLSHTLEEKILSLAMQEKCVEYSVQHMTWNTSHMLLVWGASHQFKSLEDFHREAAENSSAYSLSNYSSLGVAAKKIQSSSLEHAIQEVLQIASNVGEMKSKNSSVILSVQKVGGTYRTESSLPGELQNQVLGEGQPHIFWAKLLDGKQPQWKFISGSTQRNRKRVLYSGKEAVTEEASKKRRKVVNNVELPSQELESAGTTTPRYKEGAVRTQSSFRSPTPKTVPVNCVQSNNLETEERRKLREAQKGLHVFLKPGILELCKILKLQGSSEGLVEEFLEYMMSYHNVNTDSPTTKQAFQISLIWTVASIQDLKIDHKQSLDLARQHLDFKCRKEEAEFAYSMLRCFKTMFAYRTGKQSLSSLGVSRRVKNDVLKCVIQIKKKCQKKLQKLTKQQEEEKETIMCDYEANKVKIQDHLRMESIIIRACCEDNSPMRIDKLKQAEVSSASESEELENMKNLRLKKLESGEITARKAIQDKESRCLGAVKSWVCPELFGKRFENGSFDLLELLQNGEEVVIAQDDSNNGGDTGVSISPPSSENRNANTTTEDEASRVPEAENANDDPSTISLPNVEIPVLVPQPSHRESCLENSSHVLVQRTVALTTDSAVPSNQTCQNECPVSSASDGIQLKDSRAGDQPSASVSQLLDSAPPVNQSVLEATVTESAPQERVLPSSELLDSATVNQSVLEATVSGSAPQERLLPSSQSLDSAPVYQSVLEASISEFTPQECALPSFHPLPGENLAFDQVSQPPVSQSVHEATVSEPTAQVRAVASSNPLPSDNSVGAPLSVEIQRQPSSENCAPVQVSHAPPVPNQPVLPPVPVSLSLSSGLPAGLTERQISGSRTMIAPETNNLFAQHIPASMIFPGLPLQATPMHVNPLHKMIEGLSREFEFACKRNEDESLQLKSEYDKEIEEAVAKIKEKYELKHREKEARFTSLKDVYEQRSTRLQQTWCLCETFYTKCAEPGTSGSKSRTQQDLPINVVHQMAHSSMMQRTRQQRPPLVSTSAGRLQTRPSQQNPHATAPPPVQTTAGPGTVAPPPVRSTVSTAGPPMVVGRSNIPPSMRIPIPNAGPVANGRSSNAPPPVRSTVPSGAPSTSGRGNAPPVSQAVARPPPQVSSVSYTNAARQLSPQMSSRPPHLRSSLSPLSSSGTTPPHLRGISTPGPARGPRDISPNLVPSVEPNLNRGRDSVSDWLAGQLNVGTRVNRGPTYGRVDGQLNASGSNGTAGTRVNCPSTSGQVNVVCLSDDD